MEALFWVSAVIFAYALIGFPVLLKMLASLRPPVEVKEDSAAPLKVSFIVAAHNEEKRIERKLENLRAVDPAGCEVEFIIGSDASTDATDELIAKIRKIDGRVQTFRFDERRGKNEVLVEAVRRASGDILVFTDASVTMATDVLAVALPYFADEHIGLISSRDIWVDESQQGTSGQSSYIGLEMRIRRDESRLCSLVAASGSLLAMRKELFAAATIGTADDFALPLEIYRKGFRAIQVDDFVGRIPMVKTSGVELSRRTRIIRAGIRTVGAYKSLLNPFRYPLFSWQLWSHKVLKWLLPLFALLNVLSCASLVGSSRFYAVIFVLEAVLLFAGVLGLLFGAAARTIRPVRLAAFFLISLAATTLAWVQVLSGRKEAAWRPTQR